MNMYDMLSSHPSISIPPWPCPSSMSCTSTDSPWAMHRPNQVLSLLPMRAAEQSSNIRFKCTVFWQAGKSCWQETPRIHYNVFWETYDKPAFPILPGSRFFTSIHHQQPSSCLQLITRGSVYCQGRPCWYCFRNLEGEEDLPTTLNHI